MEDGGRWMIGKGGLWNKVNDGGRWMMGEGG